MSDEAGSFYLQRQSADIDELLRLRRLSVRLFDECGECQTFVGRLVRNQIAAANEQGMNVPEPPACPSCDGKGVVLRDGAERETRVSGRWNDTRTDGYWFPASWMEGDTTDE